MARAPTGTLTDDSWSLHHEGHVTLLFRLFVFNKLTEITWEDRTDWTFWTLYICSHPLWWWLLGGLLPPWSCCGRGFPQQKPIMSWWRGATAGEQHQDEAAWNECFWSSLQICRLLPSPPPHSPPPPLLPPFTPRLQQGDYRHEAFLTFT